MPQTTRIPRTSEWLGYHFEKYAGLAIIVAILVLAYITT